MKANLIALGITVAPVAFAGSAATVGPALANLSTQSDLLFLAVLVVAILYCLNIVIRFAFQLGRRISVAMSSARPDDFSATGMTKGGLPKTSGAVSRTSAASMPQASGNSTWEKTQAEDPTIRGQALT